MAGGCWGIFRLGTLSSIERLRTFRNYWDCLKYEYSRREGSRREEAGRGALSSSLPQLKLRGRNKNNTEFFEASMIPSFLKVFDLLFNFDLGWCGVCDADGGSDASLRSILRIAAHGWR